MTKMTEYTPSQEFTLDSAIEALVAKIAAGTATDEEKAALAQLGARRARMMRRVFHPHVIRPAAAA
jgi:hypothetical protein